MEPSVPNQPTGPAANENKNKKANQARPCYEADTSPTENTLEGKVREQRL